jgi:hypothetical protein
MLPGASLLSKYFNSSLVDFAKAAEPGHTFLEWKFNAVPRAFWDNASNRKRFIEWAEAELKISSKAEWYSISCEAIRKLGGAHYIHFHFNADFGLTSRSCHA